MCLAAIATFAAANASAISLVGAGVSALGSYQQAQAAKSAAKYDAAVAASNAKVAEFKAQDAQDRAQLEAENLGRQQAALRGKQRASIAANGIDLSSGTATSLTDAADFYGLQDQRTVAEGGVREAWGYRTQGAGYQAEAQMHRAKASSISPFGSLATSLLGSAGSLADRWSANNATGNAWRFSK
jgi:hypothetical protein